MTRVELIERLNTLCWQARSYGHDDNGLDYGVDLQGNPVEGWQDESGVMVHREAYDLAVELEGYLI